MGTAWYVAVYARAGGQAGVAAVLSACVLPFIPADAAKLLLAALLSKRLAPLCSPRSGGAAESKTKISLGAYYAPR